MKVSLLYDINRCGRGINRSTLVELSFDVCMHVSLCFCGASKICVMHSGIKMCVHNLSRVENSKRYLIRSAKESPESYNM